MAGKMKMGSRPPNTQGKTTVTSGDARGAPQTGTGTSSMGGNRSGASVGRGKEPTRNSARC